MARENKVKVSVAFPPSLIEHIDNVAFAQGLSRSALICKFCDESLAEGRASANLLSDPEARTMLGRFFTPDKLRMLAAAVREEVSDAQLRLFSGKLQREADRADQLPNEVIPLPPTDPRISPRPASASKPAPKPKNTGTKPYKSVARNSGAKGKGGRK